MKKEEFIALGISAELAEKAAEAYQEELKEYVPKSQYEEVTAAKATLAKDLKTRDEQLEELKKSSGSREELQGQIATLQAENKAAKETYEAELKELKLNAAVKLAVAPSAQDTDIVAGLVDKSKIILSEDGKITGLDEQIKTLKESKAFLFKEENTAHKTGEKQGNNYTPKAGGTNEGGMAKNIAETMNKETTDSNNPYTKAWG